MPSLPESTVARHRARTEALDVAVKLLRIEEQLTACALALPEPSRAVIESEEPPDVAAKLRGAICYSLAEYLSPFAHTMIEAATATDESLAADFLAWKSQ